MTEADGDRLGEALLAYGEFMRSSYKLMGTTQRLFGRRGWHLAGNGGSWTWRNGDSHSLTRFDWVPNYVTAAFVEMNQAEALIGKSLVPADLAGLKAVAVQVRWGDEPPSEPTIWTVRLRISAKSDKQTLAGCLLNLCNKLRQADGARPGEVAGKVAGESKECRFSGTYTAVLASKVGGSADVDSYIVGPALSGRWPAPLKPN